MSTSDASRTMFAGQIAARLDRLPFRGPVLRLVIMISMGGLFEIWNLWGTAYIVPGLVKSGLFTNRTSGLFSFNGTGFFVFTTFAGMFIGCMAFGFVADRLGRRSIFITALLWYTICTALMAFQHSAGWIDLLRFVACIGVGMEHVTIDTVLSELVPPRYRGRTYAIYLFIGFCAVPLAALFSWQLIPLTLFHMEGWRWVALIGSLAGLSVFWYWGSLPESPRWLALHGREAEAERIISALEAKATGEFGTVFPPIGPVKPLEIGSSSFAELFRNPYGRRTLMLSVLNFLQSIVVFSWASWVPTLLIAKGIRVTTSLQYAFLIAIANPIGPLLAIAIADRMERKWQITCAGLASSLLMLAFATGTNAVSVIFVGILVTLTNTWLSTAIHNYQAELFPTRIRARGVGFVYAWSRVSSAVAGLLIVFFLHKGGVLSVAWFIGASVIVMVLTVSCFGPRTSRLSLEEISH